MTTNENVEKTQNDAVKLTKEVIFDKILLNFFYWTSKQNDIILDYDQVVKLLQDVMNRLSDYVPFDTSLLRATDLDSATEEQLFHVLFNHAKRYVFKKYDSPPTNVLAFKELFKEDDDLETMVNKANRFVMQRKSLSSAMEQLISHEAD